MTPAEAVTKFRELQRSMGEGADITAFLSTSIYSETALTAVVRPNGFSEDPAFSIYAESFADLYEQTKVKWDEFKTEHRTRRVREMALEIIRITAERGVCTDAALRAGKFSAAEVEDIGPDACADATAIASNGPFSITSLAKANAA